MNDNRDIIEYAKQAFNRDPDQQKELDRQLHVFETGGEINQIASAKEMVKQNAYLQYLGKVFFKSLDKYQMNSDEKDKLIAYYHAQLEEYKRKHGQLDPKFMQKLQSKNALIPLSSASERTCKVFAMLEESSQELQNKIKQ